MKKNMKKNKNKEMWTIPGMYKRIFFNTKKEAEDFAIKRGYDTDGIYQMNINIVSENDKGEEMPMICKLEFQDIKFTSKTILVDEAEANAKLIAAAPELLSALKSIIFTFDRDLPEGSIGRMCIDSAKEVIKKATE